MDQIKESIVAIYHSNGYPVVGVSVPAGQNITSGRIYVLILTARLGEVKAAGARYFSNDWIKRQVKLSRGDEIRVGPLLDDLSWLNNNPFRTVDLIYEKGDTLAETNLLLRTQDVPPYRIFAGYENTGNIIGGDSRWLSGLNVANLFNVDHQLNVQFMTSPRMDTWWGIGGNYIAPLPWRHTFKAYGTYTIAENPGLSDPQLINPMIQNGFSWELGVRYSIPLPTFWRIKHLMAVGYDFKRTNNFLEFTRFLLFNNFFDVSQFLASYEASELDDWGETLFGVAAFLSPGGMTRFNKTRYFQEERPGAAANYAYMRGTFDRSTFLPKGCSWTLSSVYQWSSGKLLPSEELQLGGYATIRGYDENEVVSDRGVIIKNEIRSPFFSFFKMGNVRDQLQFLAFFDWGYGYQVDPNILNRNTQFLYSTGPGLRYIVNPYATIRFDYGFQLHDVKNRPFVGDETSRAHLGITIGFAPKGKGN